MLLGVSRNTVVDAIDQLYAEGYVTGRVGDGTYVSALSSPPPKHLQVEKQTVGSSVSLSAVERLASCAMPLPPEGSPRAFRVGVPAFDLFPFETWARLQARFWRRPAPALLGYGNPAGDPRLRELIAVYLRNTRGLACKASQIVITSGAQQGISLCARLLIDAGDHVALEDPGYRAAGRAFAATGARLIGIEVDGDGMCVDQLRTVKDCRLAYVTPSHQYPLGVTLSLSRRLALLEWAIDHNGWVVEDDYDGEYRYNGLPLAPLASLDRNGRVIYVGTFGKVAFPALRLGYVVLPPALVDLFTQQRALDVRTSDIGTQAVMADFIAEGHFQRHIRKMRKAAKARLTTLQHRWPTGVPGCADLPEINAGLHTCVRVDCADREAKLVRTALDIGIEINRLSDYWLDPAAVASERRAGLVLGFAAVPEAEITEALSRLSTVWKAVQSTVEG